MRVMPSKHLAQTFRRKIGSGEWAVGARLPTTRELSSEFEVSVNTIQGAFRYLEAEGLVERSPRRGGFVKAMPSEASAAVPAPAVKGIAIIAEAVSSNEPREGQNWCYRIARAAERELWRQPATQPARRLQVNEACWGLSYHPDGEHLATASLDRTVKIWDVRGERQRGTERDADDENPLVAQPPGRRIRCRVVSRALVLDRRYRSKIEAVQGPLLK